MPTLADILHTIASYPRAYDFIQRAAGRDRIYGYIREWLSLGSRSGFVIDVGGGTGGTMSVLPRAVRHVCLDMDRAKVTEYHRKYPEGAPIQADASWMPLAGGCAALAVMVGVSHHLTDEEFRKALAEIRRIVKPGGFFVFVDALYVPARPASRLLWAYDRGAHPRTERELRQMLGEYARIVESSTPALWHHRYLVCLAEPLRSGAVTTQGTRVS
jgi:ubiquinone/menaquinone biosynthesis C-methylase UbiE